jgi:hypothetical protein
LVTVDQSKPGDGPGSNSGVSAVLARGAVGSLLAGGPRGGAGVARLAHPVYRCAIQRLGGRIQTPSIVCNGLVLAASAAAYASAPQPRTWLKS